MDDEILLVDKPVGISSFGVVARVRRRLSEVAGRRVKVGHTGTLDPFATGLLILVVGKGTKRAGEFSGLDKIYKARIRLGATSSTGDPEGEITEVSDRVISRSEVERAVDSFLGAVEQVPPVFSAVKVNGERAYRLARRGEVVEMPRRTVFVYNIEVLDYRYPFLDIRVGVSSGTYVRSLAFDIGDVLGCGGYLVELRREWVGGYYVGDAQVLEEVVKDV